MSLASGVCARLGVMLASCIGALAASGCNSAAPAADPEHLGPSSSTPTPAPNGTTTAAAATSALESPTGPLCGEMPCQFFDSPAAAFEAVLREKPLVLAIGETHAQKASPSVPSTTVRFTESLLPGLAGKASALVLELWVADGKCGKAKEKAVQKKQEEVTKPQAESNQNEFVTLGEKSKAAGIVPFILKPTCDEYDKIQKAGDDAVFEMLSMITRNMKTRATALFEESQKKALDKMIVLYGGAMHNDIHPAEGREEWSFAKDLSLLAKGRYVELDLVVPEFVKDTDSWKSMPWYAAFRSLKGCDKTVLFTTSSSPEAGPKGFALVFPCTAKK